MKLAKILIVGTALLAPAYAVASDDTGGGCDWNCQTGESAVVNTQVNFGPVWSRTTTTVSDSWGDVNVDASAVGNTAEILTMQDTVVDNTQVSNSAIGAEVSASVDNVDGNVNISATALCNGIDVSTDPTYTVVNSSQECGGADPLATANANISNVSGGVGVTAMSVGNQMVTDSNAAFFPVKNFQQNSAGMTATVNATVNNVGGPVNISSTAIGNSAQIIHYNTEGF